MNMPPPRLTLASHALCPFVQRAAIVLAEKGVPYERIDVDLEDKPEWFLALSPLGKVPLLKIARDDRSEVVLFESMVICEYLEESQPGPHLHPADPIARAQHRAWIQFVSAMLGDAWGFLNAKDGATAASKGSAFLDKLRRLEEQLSDGPYFAGPTFSMVDAVAAPVFRYFDVLDPRVGEPFFLDLPLVSGWRLALAGRPSVATTVGPTFAELFRTRLEKAGALLAA